MGSTAEREAHSGTGNCISILFGGAVMTVWRTWALLAALLTASPFPGRAQDQAPERQVYRLPKNAYPHDVAPAPDGKVWYSAQQIGALGILDPQSGQARLVTLWSVAAIVCAPASVRQRHRPRSATPRTPQRERGGEC